MPQMKRELREMMNEAQQASTRALADMDTRVSAIKQRMNGMEDMLDAKVNTVRTPHCIHLSSRCYRHKVVFIRILYE